MGVLKNKLSVLKSGDRISLYLKNGMTLNGIVEENDGTESLSVRIETHLTVAYDSIMML